MARPISPTPAISGEDAKRFVAAAKNPVPFTPPKSNLAENIDKVKQILREHAQKRV